MATDNDAITAAVNEFIQQPDDDVDTACADVLARAIDSVLRDYGVPDNIEDQDAHIMAQIENEVQVVHIESQGQPSVAEGIYIYHGFENPVHIAYIPYPFLKDGLIRTFVNRLDKNEQVTPAGIYLPQGGIKS
jgi:hypothetical protein